MTVSRVLNNAGNVKPSTREKVLETVEELGYVPSGVAKRLRLKRTHTLALLVPDAPPVRGGFNSAAMAGERVLASHSELGLWDWEAADPTVAKPRFASMARGAKAVRGVLFFEGDLYCAIDDRVVRWPATLHLSRPGRPRRARLRSDLCRASARNTAVSPTSDHHLVPVHRCRRSS